MGSAELFKGTIVLLELDFVDFMPPEATLAHSAGLNTRSVWEHTWKPCLHTMQANTGPWPQVTLEAASSCQVAAFLGQYLWGA